jgi:hypothetical protein
MKAADDDHLKMKSPNNEPALIFQLVPVLFTSCSNYSELYESFEKSMQTMSNDYCNIVRDRCTSQKGRSGEFSFCEVVKVDLGASKEKKQQKHLSSTISLLQVLFLDLGLATSLYNESTDGISHGQILKPEIHLFNKANDDEDPGFLFGEGIITDFSGVKMESLAENYPHKSSAIFHIDLYVFIIPTEIPNGTNKLYHVKRPAVFQN